MNGGNKFDSDFITPNMRNDEGDDQTGKMDFRIEGEMMDATKEVCLKVHLNDPMKLTVKNEKFLCKTVEVIDANGVVHRFKFEEALKGCNTCEADDVAILTQESDSSEKNSKSSGSSKSLKPSNDKDVVDDGNGSSGDSSDNNNGSKKPTHEKREMSQISNPAEKEGREPKKTRRRRQTTEKDKGRT